MSSGVVLLLLTVVVVLCCVSGDVLPGYRTRFIVPTSPDGLVTYVAAGYGDIVLAADTTEGCHCEVVASVSSDYTRFYVLSYLVESISRIELFVRNHQEQAATVSARVEAYTGVLANLTQRMDYYHTLDSEDLLHLADELSGYSVELDTAEATMADLVSQHDSLSIITSYETALTNISHTLVTMFDEATVDLIHLQAQVEYLQSQLDTCNDDSSRRLDPPLPPTVNGDCSHRVVTSVGEPFTHRWSDSVSGAWMRDPQPLEGRQDVVYKIKGHANQKVLYEYDNIDDFEAGIRATTHGMSLGIGGTGHVVYRGILYYAAYNSRILVKYNIATSSEVLRKTLPDAGYQNTYRYELGYYNDIDFAVDEMGLWVIYSTPANQAMIVISRLDPDTLDLLDTWNTNVVKLAVGESFMICGRLHMTDSPAARFDRITNIFDTNSGLGELVVIPLSNKYMKMTSLDYNPSDGRLYGWDNFHPVSYELRF